MNILCIDFSYIFSSCIRLYADRVEDRESPVISWDMLEKRFGIESVISYDATILMKIAKLIKRSIDSNSHCKLYVSDDHKDIVKFVKTFSNEQIDVPPEERYNPVCITNISFFDNMNFSYGRGKTGIIRYDNYNEKNWLAYLKLKKFLERAMWVKSPNSDIFAPSTDLYSTIYTSIDEVSERFDRIYIIRSPLYVPYKYQHLIDLIVDCLSKDEKEHL